jgi:hypothetical protein
MLEDFITKFQDIFAVKSDDSWWTDSVYHHINTSDACLIRQPPHRLLLAKQAEVNEMLKNMKEGVFEESDSPWALPIMLIWKKMETSVSVWTTGS